MPIVFRSIILTIGLCWGFQAAVSDEQIRLKGDTKAVEAIERMLERFGGRSVWQRAHILYVEYNGWRTNPNEPVIERAWRNVRKPMQRTEFEGQSFYTVSVITPAESATSRNGEITKRSAEQHANTLARYPFGFYNSFHTFAVSDDRVRLEWNKDKKRVIVKSNDGVERSWYEIDNTGALIRWGVDLSDGRSFAYVYGPMRSFGNVNFPAWGAALNGFWRWDYVTVDVSTDTQFPVSVAISD